MLFGSSSLGGLSNFNLKAQSLFRLLALLQCLNPLELLELALSKSFCSDFKIVLHFKVAKLTLQRAGKKFFVVR
jgi:hypothetical protein